MVILTRRKACGRKLQEKRNKIKFIDRRKGFDLYHTEIVIIRKEVCPTFKFGNIDQVTFNDFY